MDDKKDDKNVRKNTEIAHISKADLPKNEG
jgi:hypothetical protein